MNKRGNNYGGTGENEDVSYTVEISNMIVTKT